MYKIVETEVKVLSMCNNEFHPVLTLADEHGGRCQIALDDKCYVLYLRQKNAKYIVAHHIFPEAFEALKTLPNPLEMTRRIVEDG